MKLNLKIWRQKDAKTPGKFVDYALDHVSPEMSFLEMLDVLNEELVKKGEEPVAFDHDCREGICGSCGVVINGKAHGGQVNTTTCQLYMRHYNDGDTVLIEPFRARAFPVVKDLCVDRQSLDRVVKAGGYISAHVGSAVDGNTIPIGKELAEKAFDAGTCIQCGACVAACKNASAMLFTSAQTQRLNLLPQGKVELSRRVTRMIAAMDEEKFGACTNEAECSAVCPKGISFKNITEMNHNYLKSSLE